SAYRSRISKGVGHVPVPGRRRPSPGRPRPAMTRRASILNLGGRGTRLVIRSRSMLNDLRLALRLFGRAPGFAAAAVVSIGLAIGSNAAIFSLADALFMAPLDVPDPSGLVTLGPRPWQDDGRHSLPDYADF